MTATVHHRDKTAAGYTEHYGFVYIQQLAKLNQVVGPTFKAENIIRRIIGSPCAADVQIDYAIHMPQGRLEDGVI